MQLSFKLYVTQLLEPERKLFAFTSAFPGNNLYVHSDAVILKYDSFKEQLLSRYP